MKNEHQPIFVCCCRRITDKRHIKAIKITFKGSYSFFDYIISVRSKHTLNRVWYSYRTTAVNWLPTFEERRTQASCLRSKRSTGKGWRTLNDGPLGSIHADWLKKSCLLVLLSLKWCKIQTVSLVINRSSPKSTFSVDADPEISTPGTLYARTLSPSKNEKLIIMAEKW